VCNPRGEILAQASATEEDIVVADVDLSVIPELRALWGYYRDRRPDLYGPLVTTAEASAAPRRRGGLSG
jgi:N-carbamoylputrescine amidase